MEAFDPTTVFVWRAVERLIAVLIGGGSIYLGFRLFMALPKLSTEGEGKFELPGGVSIYVSRVGPGVFFALFGTALVGLSFVNVLTWNPAQNVVYMGPPDRQNAGFSYVSGDVGDAQVALERDTVVRDLRTLRRLEGALAQHTAGNGFDFTRADTASVLIALPRVKRMMLHGVWDSAWGDYQVFAQWVRDGAPSPPPAGLSEMITDVFEQGK
ncbi:MAG: hypothetical protein GWN84_09905 [Gammaproteobacteria bacterium]|nr:hypothetical protein [Gammaproteobacteria bacterium]NIR83177.1 hypothetical protein [Gammaproteobacteria bacterium]NIR90985.1 hypothetical protein [Gammaproteobacteria bacterium]NIU04342.1 hypothetical protein [Gammaproteobacteria bacterium]NIV52565.1 hypothetical protein [Gammaproteobacteria bacterium]